MTRAARPWWFPFAAALTVAAPVTVLDFVFGDPWRLIGHDAMLASIAAGSVAWALSRRA